MCVYIYCAAVVVVCFWPCGICTRSDCGDDGRDGCYSAYKLAGRMEIRCGNNVRTYRKVLGKFRIFTF